MASLGSFGKQHAPVEAAEPDTFDWFGSSVRLSSEVNEVELIDLMETFTQLDEANPTAIVVVKNGFRLILHPDDFDGFWTAAKQNRQKIEDLMPVLQALMEAATDRPTQQPSDSSPGRLVTPVNSPVVSPSQVLPGRPDLELLQQGGEDTRRDLEARARQAALAG